MCQGTTNDGRRCSRKVEPYCKTHQPAEPVPGGGRNRQAVEATIAELAQGEFDGTIRGVDAAKLQLARSLADQVDAEPGNAQMWRQYADALEGLVPENVSANPRDELTEMLRTLGDAAPSGAANNGGT